MMKKNGTGPVLCGDTIQNHPEKFRMFGSTVTNEPNHSHRRYAVQVSDDTHDLFVYLNAVLNKYICHHVCLKYVS